MFCIHDSSNANCHNWNLILRISYTLSSLRSSPILFLHIVITLKHAHAVYAIRSKELLLKQGYTFASTAQKTHRLRKSPLASIYTGRMNDLLQFQFMLYYNMLGFHLKKKIITFGPSKGAGGNCSKTALKWGSLEEGLSLCVFHVSLINHTQFLILFM